MKKLNFLLFIFSVSLFLSSCDTQEGDHNYEGSFSNPEDKTYNEKYKEYNENPFVSVSEIPTSTFSVDADGASYTNMRRYINLGQLPPKASVRIEEYINFFTFDYPEPSENENISIDTEVSTCFWEPSHQLMRIGIKGKTISNENLPATNYVFLIDVSGSMNSPDKIGILKTGFKTLVDNLNANDRVAIVTYANNSGVALESTPCDQKETIHKAIDQLMAGGSTAGAAGIETAYEIAQQYYTPNGNNRIIIGSDGDFNVGRSSVEEIIVMIEENRDRGIYLTTLGVGGGNYNDHMMEQIANKGNGTYEYIDNVEQISKIFIQEKSKLYTIAKDVKIQVTFDPEMVDSYRLIGYENRALKEEDFDDDKKDAGEIGIGQTITALYEIVPKKSSKKNALAQLDVRYKKTDKNPSRLLSTKINPHTSGQVVSENQRHTAAVAAYAMILKESKYAGNANKKMVLDLANNSNKFDPHGYRAEFIEIVKKSTIK